MRSADGSLTVKGLLPGQQLVQMPDGKLQVLTTTQIQATTQASTPKTTTTKTVIKSANTPAGKVVLQGNQVKTIVQASTQSPAKGQVIVKQQSGNVQKIAAPNTVVVGGNQVITQQQVIVSGSPVIATPGTQQVFIYSKRKGNSYIKVFQIVTNQIVVNNQNLAQQIASGKVQVATINGQQVLIRPTGNNQAQIVAQLTPAQPIQQQQQQITQVQTVQSPVKQIQTTTETTAAIPKQDSQTDQTMDQLLAGQPPGTLIKCVTAQVIQTQQGPRIVLQGLQGADFTPQQLAAVQQQVKQQLLKGKKIN